jgi:hypothetical protein
MATYVGKTIEYRNKYGTTVTATVTRTEKLLYPAGATGLVHLVDGEECVVAWRPGIVKG